MANTKYDGKYLRCDIAFVKDAGVGGRLYSAEINEEVPNGVIGVMGATKADKPEVKAFTLGVKAGEDMYIVMKPEINYEERHRTDYALGIFRNKANKPFPIIRLQKRDRITLSEDFIKLEAAQITVGKKTNRREKEIKKFSLDVNNPKNNKGKVTEWDTLNLNKK